MKNAMSTVQENWRIKYVTSDTPAKKLQMYTFCVKLIDFRINKSKNIWIIIAS